MSKYLGIDVGGSYIKYAVIDDNGEIELLDKIKTPQDCESFLKEIFIIIQEKLGKISGIGVSCPGKIDSLTGTIYYGGSLPFLHELNLKGLIEKEFSLPCSVVNDGKAAALGEQWIGNLKNIDYGAVIVLGTGVGGAILVDGKILNGKNYQAGELSFIIDENELMGHKASAVNFINEGNLLLKSKGDDWELVFESLERKNPEMILHFEKYCFSIAKLIYNLQVILDLEKVLIGGGISNQNILLIEIKNQYLKLREKFKHTSNMNSEIEIDTCKFLSESNLLGSIKNLKNNIWI